VVQLRDALLMNSGKNQSKKEKEAAYVNLKYQNCFLLRFSRAIMYCPFLQINRGNYIFILKQNEKYLPETLFIKTAISIFTILTN
jgi:hypothetical protein